MRTLKYLVTFLVLLTFTACDSLIEDVQDPIDSVDSEELNSADQVDFLITGVQARFSNTYDNVTVLSSLLSDQFLFGGNTGGGATFPTYRDLDLGAPTLDNNSVDTGQNYLGEYLFLADDLIDRVAAIDDLGPDEGGFAGGNEDPNRLRALFVGHFHGGLARYFWATYWGRSEREGGGVISDLDTPADPERGDFIPSAAMYQQALDKLDEAEAYADAYDAAVGNADGYSTRLINSVRARIHLFQNDLDAAETAAENGLEPGDAPLRAEYIDRATNQQNEWFSAGGPGRVQTIADFRFINDYLGGDLGAPESARIPLAPDGTVETANGEVTIYRQALYESRDAAIDFITWQENELMLAEIEVRQGEGDPLSRVNEVRAASLLDDLDSVDLDVIYEERDKELFTQGLRLPDQRRAEENSLNVDPDAHYWHLAEDTWWYLPITLAERNNNPNF